ncbi:MAG: M15 family metallopeptidase [Bacteroidetes bacterium]|nr:M15 family metallopeptidase [Bacteroidota bacterium]MBS1633175.1 M15 family metallopeptidase [Bacteroidota bacterium]
MSNNIRNQLNIQLIIFVVFSIVPTFNSFAQVAVQNYPEVTKNLKEYRIQVENNSDKKMVELKSIIPGLVYDIRYATTNNFMHRKMYPGKTNYTFLRKPAAESLLNVQKELNEKGLGLKIFDAYRPYSVTMKFWELVHDERYVANPAKGSGHNRGIAVDLTIIKLKTGDELNMGTGFDNFTDSAHQVFTDLPKEVLQNRALLKSTMEKYGFKALETEWWHFYLPDGDKFEVLDISFKKLKKIS